MKANQFKELIRKLVAEEVVKTLPKLLFEMLGQQAKPVLKEQITPTRQLVADQIPDDVFDETMANMSNHPAYQTKKELKRYTADPVLNEILNATKSGLSQSPYGSSLVDLEGGGFDKLSQPTEEYVPQQIQETTTPTPSVTSVPNPLSKVLNRDYSKFMKIVDQKAKGGMIGGSGALTIGSEW